MNEVQEQFEAKAGGKTQNEKLREYLVAHPHEWLAMPELAQVITATGIGAAVHSRVNDLRQKFEMQIDHKQEGRKPVRSFYRYVPVATQDQLALGPS